MNKEQAGENCKGIDNSQEGWRIRSNKVELFITKNGGHVAPVHFCTDTDNPVQPYYLSPWQNEKIDEFPDPLLAPLRGDFFCMPFGGNSEEVDGEKHPAHGEVSSSQWTCSDLVQTNDVTSLTLELETKVRPGKVTKQINLVAGQNVLYTTHKLEGYSGKMPLGHHSILSVPEEEGAIQISVGNFELGMTCPGLFSDPVNGEYQALALGATFTDLLRVPSLWKDPPFVDCSRFPLRTGFTDLVKLLKKPTDIPAWTAAVYRSEGYLWFSLKCSAVLPASLFWMSNRGRHGFPWNGRNRCLGLEECCAWFADGLGPSVRPNSVTKAGFPTAIELSPDAPTSIHFIQGVAHVPPDFGKVEDVRFSPGTATFVSAEGQEVCVEVNHQFLKTGEWA